MHSTREDARFLDCKRLSLCITTKVFKIATRNYKLTIRNQPTTQTNRLDKAILNASWFFSFERLWLNCKMLSLTLMGKEPKNINQATTSITKEIYNTKKERKKWIIVLGKCIDKWWNNNSNMIKFSWITFLFYCKRWYCESNINTWTFGFDRICIIDLIKQEWKV